MTEADKKLADEIFEWIWPYFLQMKEPERLKHKDWNVPPNTAGLKETIFAMMDIYHNEKSMQGIDKIELNLVNLSLLVQGMNSYIHERLDK